MKPSNNKEWKKAFAAVKSLIKDYDIVTFGSAVYDEYINGNLELPERFVDMADQAGAPHTTPDLTDWGWGIFEAVKNGELVFSDDELNAIECYCENPSWMYNRKGKRIDEMRKRIQLNEAQLKQIIKEAVQSAIQQQVNPQGQTQMQQPQQHNIRLMGRIVKKESLPHAFIVTQVNGKVFVWKTDGKRGDWVRCTQGDVIYRDTKLKFKSGSSLYTKSNDDRQEYFCDETHALGTTKLGRLALRAIRPDGQIVK